uniref:Uncharacterized protein n=1 Tax=Magallana gigas TaxID=29159 RepID=K1RDG6_MAGGI
MNDMRGQGTVSCQEFGQFIGNSIVHIQIRLDPERHNHFDTQLRKRVCGKRKEGTVLRAKSLQKGSLGVRLEKARCDKPKILPTVKTGSL